MPKKTIKDKNETIIIGKSPPILKAKDTALKAAKANSAVFISGDSGVGKEVFARFIHENSMRTDKPFIPINCAALPEPLLESELFGHTKGAFTGATGEHEGKFEAANGGTLFLDEIGDMALITQAKMLRVLQDKKFEPLGSNKTIKVDVRIIAATNKNIDQLISEGGFREDLFFRFNIIKLEIPPLRNRLEDVPEFAEYILAQKSHSKKYFTAQAMEAIKEHSYWRNNVRELENIIEEGIVMAEDDPYIQPHHLNFSHSSGQECVKVVIDKSNLNMAQHIVPLQKMLVQEAMAKHSGVKSKVAKELGISLFLLEKLLKNSPISSQACLQYSTDEKTEKKTNTNKLSKEKHQEQQPSKKLDIKSKAIMEMAERNAWVSNNMVQEKLKISAWAAKRLLSSLVNHGALLIEGSGRGAHYILSSLS